MSRRKRGYKPNSQNKVEAKDQKPTDQKPADKKDDTSTGSKEENCTDKPGYNDPAWYTRFPELAFGSGNLPYGEPFGSLMKLKNITGVLAKSGTKGVVFDPDTTKFRSVAGICSLVVHPSYGLSYDRNHPLNVAAQMFYTNVRYVNSGRKNYEAADLMIYALAISELYSFIMYCQRLYGYAFMYSQRNYFVGKSLIDQNGVNGYNLVANLANFRYWLNAFINKVSSFAVPADISLFARRIFMFAHMYTESTTTNIKDQLYQFVPQGFYKFMLDDSGKGKLSFQKFQDQDYTVDGIMEYGENLLSNIFGDEDFGLMSGDIIKAYGSNIVGLVPLPEEVIVVPEYEEFVLSQFKNATIVGDDINFFGNTQITFTISTDSTVQNAGDICQDGKGNLVSINVLAGTKVAPICSTAMEHMMSVTNPVPDINDNFEATRLMVGSAKVDTNVFTFTDSGTEKDYRRYIICGSDFITRVKEARFIYDANGNNGTSLEVTTVGSNVVDHSLANMDLVALNNQFKWSPMMWAIHFTATSDEVTTISDVELVSNVDNYTFVDNAILQRIHEAALLSLTFVPGVSKVVG